MDLSYAELMRITVDVDESTLDELLQITGEKAKSPAVAKAVEQFVKRAKARDFAVLIREGEFDYPAEGEKEEIENLSW